MGKSRNAGTANGRYSHGMSRTLIYHVWQSMMQRCYKTTSRRYHTHGGRGIAVCQRWHDFAAWHADIMAAIGPCPKGRSLDRINNDGNYEPGNVRWATPKEQANNRRWSGPTPTHMEI